MNKEKLIFFGAIGVVVLIMVIYGVSVYSKKDTSSGSAAADFTVPDLVEKDKTKEEYNNRLKKANAYQEPEAKQDLSKTANFKTYQSEPRKVVEIRVQYRRPGNKAGNTETRAHKSKRRNTGRNKKRISTEEKEDTGGFGIIVSERSVRKKIPSGSQAKNGGFTAAMLEEDTKIKNQSSVVFFLLEDLAIDGKVFKKNAILYGKAIENTGMFSI